MGGYTIQSDKLDKNKVFILRKSEMEKRFDPFYYIPKLVELEKIVLSKQPKKLREYVKTIASGATPKTTESEKYYTDKESGIPFLRVQNLSNTGVLEFEDCKYINKETNDGLLKRSQVSEGDLLVKITGVGRMAVASVAPEGFEGNINQHICVIKTGSKVISEQLAAFLNTDIAEKLASRRATGGTRPALDYPALLSMPILNDSRILEITHEVVKKKIHNDAEAEKLLKSIDEYLLCELGIELPVPHESALKNRIYLARMKNISGNRFDPFYHQEYFQEIYYAIVNGKYKTTSLGNCISKWEKGIEVGSKEYQSEGIPFVRVSDITDHLINFEAADKRLSAEKFEELKDNYKPKKDEILYTKDGTVGLSCVVENEEDYIVSSGILRITAKEDIHNYFLNYLLSSKLYKQLANRLTIGTVIKHLTIEDWLKLIIPLPPFQKQQEIADHISNIRQNAKSIKDDTYKAIKVANEEIEAILLG